MKLSSVILLEVAKQHDNSTSHPLSQGGTFKKQLHIDEQIFDDFVDDLDEHFPPLDRHWVDKVKQRGYVFAYAVKFLKGQK